MGFLFSFSQQQNHKIIPHNIKEWEYCRLFSYHKEELEKGNIMDMKKEGIEIYCLPDEANCQADEHKRSPLEIEECPKEYEECTGDCFYYSETIN